ncbi:MAG: hypothetical protein AB8G22_14145 [Saprospiraceae bacterium]
MGLNVTIHVLENNEGKELFSFVREFLNDLQLKIEDVKPYIFFKNVFDELYFEFRGKRIGIAEYNSKVIFFDQNSFILRKAAIKQFTKIHSCLFFTYSRGDTAGVDYYDFYQNGENIRSYSNNEGDIREKGKRFDFEIEYDSFDSILEHLVLPFYKFDQLEWSILDLAKITQ